MKKITFLFIFAVLSSFGAGAQSFNSSDPSIHMWGDTVTLVSHLTIFNTSASSKTVHVVRSNNNLASGHSSYFCWGTNCYTPPTDFSSTPQIIAAGGSDHSFLGYLNPRDSMGPHLGTSIVQYCFYDASNPGDSVCVDMTYIFTPVGIGEISSKTYLSNPYPNPADALTSISYNVSDSKNARMIIYNMLGSAVKEIKLAEKQSTILIATSDLKQGVYFYSIVTDGKQLASKKLVISHR